ncbi:MAG TPA: tetratricopeptide repeat protein [Pirellulales bacterium]|jgi:tetratricopeptide (TPR) repeat protein
MSTDPFAARGSPPTSDGVDDQSRLDDAMRRADQLLLHSLQGDDRRRHRRFLIFVLMGGAAMITGLCAIALLFVQSANVQNSDVQVAEKADTGVAAQITTAEQHVTPAAAIQLAADRAGQLSIEGWQLWGQQNYPAAAAKFEESVKLDKRNSNAWNGLGWASFNSGNRGRAREAFLAVIKLEPKHPAALNGLGQMALADGKYDEAEKYLSKAALAPDASAAWYGLTKIYLLQGKYAEAAKWGKKTVASGDPDGSAQRMLDAAKAKELPDDLRRELEPMAVAENAPKKSAAPAINVGKDVGQAWRLMNQGRREEAKSLFTAVLAKSPDNGGALNGMGWLLLNGGEVDEAKGYFEKVLATDPLAGGAMNGLARVLKSQGDDAGAIKLWQQMVDKLPGPNAGTSGLADVYLENEEYKNALPLFEQLAKANPGDEQTKQKLAKAKAGATK